MSEVNDLHQQWMKDDPEHRQAYAELAPEFELAHALIKARVTAGLTQEQLAAERMETSQSFVARLESGRTRPSTQTLGTACRGHRYPAENQLCASAAADAPA